jgi:1-deoxy-D-xylulose-5-phosphate synthase
MTHPLLDKINSPAELRALEREMLPQVADELRAFVLESVSKTGGHLSSNLGTVELTVALHYVFNTPEDRLVWDVGHQTYRPQGPDRAPRGMERLRMKDGVSGFPRRIESEYDTFGVGHSSTSISAALGMAVAARNKGEERRVVAIIGDGAMSAGQAFEALNNAGVIDANLLVILNDNDMSISPPVGALNKYLARLLSGRHLQRGAARRREGALGHAQRAGVRQPGRGARQGHDLARHAVRGTWLQLHRPHRRPRSRCADPDAAEPAPAQGPAVPARHHAQGPGLQAGRGRSHALPRRRQVRRGQWHRTGQDRGASDLYAGLRRLAVRPGQGDPRLVGITPAMREGSGMVRFAAEFPQRYFDVGIAEQHAVTFAGGLACEGMRPVVAIYSTFLQRAYDQLIHDIALQNLPVVFAIDRGGLVGADGATHNGAFDLSYLPAFPTWW